MTLTDLSLLGSVSDIWDEWRFKPWKNGSAEGLYRRLTMMKSSLIGEIAKYYADDYIVWKYYSSDIDRIMQSAKPDRDLMVQRYVFLQRESAGSFKKFSFMFGFRGFIEIYRYKLGDYEPKGIKDVAYLCNAADRRLQTADQTG